MRELSSGAVTVGNTSTVLLTKETLGTYTRMGVDINNAAGGGALNAFKIEVKYHNDGAWYEWLADTDFDSTTIAALLTCTDTGPHELGADASAGFSVELGAFQSIRFSATSATSSTVTLRGWIL